MVWLKPQNMLFPLVYQTKFPTFWKLTLNLQVTVHSQP